MEVKQFLSLNGLQTFWTKCKNTYARISHTHVWADITDKPAIGNGTITVTQNGASKGTFTLNQTGNTTIALTDTGYTLPTASASVLGGIKVGANLTITDGVLAGTPNTTYSDATTSAHGLMTAAMVTKLNGIADGANKYILPAATASTLGGVKIEGTLTAGSTNAIQNGVVQAAIASINAQIATLQSQTGAVTQALVYKGVVAADAGLPATHKAGWTYIVQLADNATSGTIAGQNVENGDMLICNANGTAANNAHWNVVQANTGEITDAQINALA